ncbi:Zeatin o-glucosyltransferase [Thalictrum thalictroides]|uniref:Zeatin o-glucosyltransferase n=1 Tax=Thalictrum thalictroides TaxID=46969 RepID=A0A7J6W746_THATH|nr:Zeatin o-glucosyltransferase [Thalictrum thalictroides]
MQWAHLSAGSTYNTCDAIEGRFVDFIAGRQLDKKVWAMGPCNPVTIETAGGAHNSDHKCLEWLNKQPPTSVIFVSFGTTTTMSDDEITQIAMGLEKSEQRFIWVLRDADQSDIYEGKEGRNAQLPNGFEERIKGRGLVVRDWAPQIKVLAHPSTGGFLSRCGWNSCLESLSMGVPIAALPSHSDHPANSLLVTQVLKVGLLVREWEQKDELLSADTIACSIRKLMVSDEGNMMRKRAKDLGANVRSAVSTGGSSTIHLESFLNHISRPLSQTEI